MIRYSLKCAAGHTFDSWFQSADAFDTLVSRAMVSCTVCASSEVSKALMAPGVAVNESDSVARPLSTAPHPAEQALRALRAELEKNSTYVGKNFAKEARKMHLGDAPEKPIHGEARPEEARALIEDGIPVMPLPILPKDRAN